MYAPVLLTVLAVAGLGWFLQLFENKGCLTLLAFALSLTAGLVLAAYAAERAFWSMLGNL